MADPMKPEFTAQNPIVEAASRLRARREMDGAIDRDQTAADRPPEDAEESMAALHARLLDAAKRLNAIVGNGAVKIIRLERPIRLRVRFGDKKISLELDEVHQLVHVRGCNLDGEYQFDLSSAVPALFSVSKISTQAGYHDALTASSLLKTIAQDAELPRPSHLDSSGPLQL
jgi:hypothetical protein